MSVPVRDPEADGLRHVLLRMVRDEASRRRLYDSDVARQSGVTGATFSRVMDGQQVLSLDIAVHLARWLGFAIELVAREDGAP